MTRNRSSLPPGPANGDAERQARLAEALRANLRRRKAQARGASEQVQSGDQDEPVGG